MRAQTARGWEKMAQDSGSEKDWISEEEAVEEDEREDEGDVEQRGLSGGPLSTVQEESEDELGHWGEGGASGREADLCENKRRKLKAPSVSVDFPMPPHRRTFTSLDEFLKRKDKLARQGNFRFYQSGGGPTARLRWRCSHGWKGPAVPEGECPYVLAANEIKGGGVEIDDDRSCWTHNHVLDGSGFPKKQMGQKRGKNHRTRSNPPKTFQELDPGAPASAPTSRKVVPRPAAPLPRPRHSLGGSPSPAQAPVASTSAPVSGLAASLKARMEQNASLSAFGAPPRSALFHPPPQSFAFPPLASTSFSAAPFSSALPPRSFAFGALPSRAFTPQPLFPSAGPSQPALPAHHPPPVNPIQRELARKRQREEQEREASAAPAALAAPSFGGGSMFGGGFDDSTFFPAPRSFVAGPSSTSNLYTDADTQEGASNAVAGPSGLKRDRPPSPPSTPQNGCKRSKKVKVETIDLTFSDDEDVKPVVERTPPPPRSLLRQIPLPTPSAPRAPSAPLDGGFASPSPSSSLDAAGPGLASGSSSTTPGTAQPPTLTLAAFLTALPRLSNTSVFLPLLVGIGIKTVSALVARLGVRKPGGSGLEALVRDLRGEAAVQGAQVAEREWWALQDRLEGWVESDYS
ncbi:hypothetical protein JCM10207_005761 [Rhodosporidiobolus poonsookiae]